jgi:RNA polymerase sigma-70 factor (ECF subfamily)
LEDVLNRLTGDEIRRAMAAIPTEQRQTIELAYFDGYTHAEIAQMLNLPLGTVKGRMRIGLQKLRGLLEGSQAEMAVE